jgi:hypothetical protein
MKLKLIIILLLIVIPLHSQIVNIENDRIPNDTTLFTGYVKLYSNFFQYESRTFQLGNEFHIQYKKNNVLVLFITDLNVLKSGSELIQCYNDQHLRFNYNLNKYLTYESFLQTQYNYQLDINLRTDFGNGLRLRIKDKKFKVFYGLLIMYEYYVNNHQPCYQNGLLLDNYLSFNIKFNKNFKINNTVYYEPYIFNLNNYRILNNFTTSFNVSKCFALDESFNVLYYRYHPSNIGSFTSNQIFSLRYNF